MMIGNFITSAFTRDFTPMELLRKPVLFPGQRQDKFFLFKIPKGFPHTDLVICIGERLFVSKVKDAALKSGLQNHDEKNNLLVVDASPLFLEYDDQQDISIAKAAYFPWYRFVTEPIEFFKIENVNTFVTKSIYYLTKVRGVESQYMETEEGPLIKMNGLYGCTNNTLKVLGNNQLNSISLISGDGKFFDSTLDLKERKITLNKNHSELFFTALETIVKKNNKLENIEINVDGDSLSLIYIKG